MPFFKAYRGVPMEGTEPPDVLVFGPYSTHEEAMQEPGPHEGFVPLESSVIEAPDIEEATRLAEEAFGPRAPDSP